METSTIELIACVGILSLVGLVVLAITALIERPWRKPSRGRSINLR